MKVVIPMAGRGSRFANQGLTVPKPLIEVADGKSIFLWALESIRAVTYSQLIFIILREHDEQFQLQAMLRSTFGADIGVVVLDDVTEGQLCTVVTAREWIDTDEDVLVISSDTYVVSSIGEDIRNRKPDCTGIISVASMPGEQWSFARTDPSGRVVEVTEKVRISDHASTGMYYFSNGHQLVTIADAMIRNNERTRGEFYVMPVYQKYIERGWRVEISQATEMWDMGNPAALAAFRAQLIAKNQ
ncbi:MAG: glycosyltransferase family 2 protein [Anaerolineae bacterium]|nr:glycosyltransferase family 2 protein [Anaerolineae bacterium]